MTSVVLYQQEGRYACHIKAPFFCALGSVLPELELVYETYGTLNEKRDNAILIHHALSTSSHVASQAKNPTPGWWEAMVGPNKPIDTEQYFVICINNLGSCFGSTGPNSFNPVSEKQYQADFPTVTFQDMVRSQKILLEALGIHQLRAVIGNSMGGMISLEWAITYPETCELLVLTSSCYKAYPHNIANRALQREIIELDPVWQQGFYDTQPYQGFKLARKMGLLTYRNRDELNERFENASTYHSDDKRPLLNASAIENYLEYNAHKFVQQFDANAYLYLLKAMDLFDVTQGFTDLLTPFRKISAKTLVISVNSDLLFPSQQQEELYEYLKAANVDVSFIEHHSGYGHDAFLVEVAAFGQYLRSFLAQSQVQAHA